MRQHMMLEFAGMISILNIQWGVNESEVLVSEKDAKLPFFSEFETPFTN
jgi:dTDP-4-dehydrorhamnose 3,5-epimerase-like enzyme